MSASKAIRRYRRASSRALPRRMIHALSSSGRSSTSKAMTKLKLFAITNVLCVWMIGAPQIDSFEKQALSLVQAMPASALDAELPGRSFASWFGQVIGPKAGVVWQLTECGEQIVAPDKTGQDLPACAEVNANLPNGRKVFVMISVGTFKKGLTGKPVLFRAVIEQNEQFYLARRLSDLDRKSTRLNSSHVAISYAVFCLKKKKK